MFLAIFSNLENIVDNKPDMFMNTVGIIGIQVNGIQYNVYDK